MKWSNLLSEERLGKSIEINSLTEKKYPRSEFAKDYRRIIASASFRRLQDKTQVFPLDQSDFVRTRLTHSYEVSALSKTLGIMLLTVLAGKEGMDEDDKKAIINIPDVLACSGLLHDIGNPPFGHFGEEIIKKWFANKLSNCTINVDGKNVPLNKILVNVHCSDLEHFDGNAQALRVLTKLHFQDSDYGLNLTSSVLNILIKYPTASDKVKSKEKQGYSLLNKKMGFSDEDKINYEKITSFTGAKHVRHPLAFILEAADDIAYKTADIEDGFKKGLYTLDELLTFIDERIDEYKKGSNEKTIPYVTELFEELKKLRRVNGAGGYQKEINNVDLYAIQNWVPYAQEWLMNCSIFRFDQSYLSIMEGQYEHDLFFNTNHAISVKIIDDIMKRFIFPNRNIVKLELAADTILSNLLNKFTDAVLFHDKKYSSEKHIEFQAYEKLYMLISDNYRETYKLSLSEFCENSDPDAKSIMEYDIYLRLLLVVDYISGMTDSYAKSLYQELNGIYGLSGIY